MIIFASSVGQIYIQPRGHWSPDMRHRRYWRTATHHLPGRHSRTQWPCSWPMQTQSGRCPSSPVALDRQPGHWGGETATTSESRRRRQETLETHTVSTLTKRLETHTSFLLYSLSVSTTAFKDARMLCSLCCCRGDQGKHAAVKRHFHLFPPVLGNCFFCGVFCVYFKQFRHQRHKCEGGRIIFHWVRWPRRQPGFYKNDQ